MRIHRCHINQPLDQQSLLEIRNGQAHYLSRVLRLRHGAEVIVFDGRGGEYRARIEALGRDRVRLRLIDHRPVERESPLTVRLLQGVSRGEKMDFALQKATELGVIGIIPVLTGFSVVRLSDEQAERRRRHWQSVVISACEQCGRNRVPAVATPTPLAQALDELPADGPRWLLDCSAEQALGTDPQPLPGHTITVLVGPEGGWQPDEIQLARQHAVQPRRLGPRVLRTETAAVAALAMLQALWGDLQS